MVVKREASVQEALDYLSMAKRSDMSLTARLCRGYVSLENVNKALFELNSTTIKKIDECERESAKLAGKLDKHIYDQEQRIKKLTEEVKQVKANQHKINKLTQGWGDQT